MGTRLGEALVAALRAEHASPPLHVSNLGVAAAVVSVPLQPLPSEAVASSFLKEQTDWLDERRRAAPDDAATADGGPFSACALPQATSDYATRLLLAARNGEGATHAPLGVMAVAFGPNIALLGIEAEPFCEYALHLAATSPFDATLTLGYANGCHGYLPTSAEIAFGGYEVLHAHVPYGQLQKLGCNRTLGSPRGIGFTRLMGAFDTRLGCALRHGVASYGCTYESRCA